VAAARRVFLRHGYADTSIEMIATEAGVSKQTIYNHFGGKEQLFTGAVRAVQETAVAAAVTDFAGQFTETGDLDRDLRAAVRLIAQAIMRGDVAAFRRLVITEQLRHPELMDQWTQAAPGLEKFFAREIERQASLGTVEVDDAGLAARQLMMLVLNEAVSQSRYGLRPLSDPELTAIVNDGVGLWLRAYRTRTAP
jgi:AcrR family transcriptional regulator